MNTKHLYVLALLFITLFIIINGHTIEGFDSLGRKFYQNPPRKTSYSRLYFPGLVPESISKVKSRKRFPSLHYPKSYQNPNMKLVKIIQNNAM